MRLTIPSIQWVGDHPFTVMATGRIDNDSGYFDLAIKAQRGFTRKLGLKSSGSRGLGYGSSSSIAGVQVKVEGPYGQLSEHVSVAVVEFVAETVDFLVHDRSTFPIAFCSSAGESVSPTFSLYSCSSLSGDQIGPASSSG